ncbi:hypothetical protein, partial [Kocuria marina]|uniref:hypothetical protein n=1 Tax=Kocuria marina TaxID=223184 RepID=UPI001643D6B1
MMMGEEEVGEGVVLELGGDVEVGVVGDVGEVVGDVGGVVVVVVWQTVCRKGTLWRVELGGRWG